MSYFITLYDQYNNPIQVPILSPEAESQLAEAVANGAVDINKARVLRGMEHGFRSVESTTSFEKKKALLQLKENLSIARSLINCKIAIDSQGRFLLETETSEGQYKFRSRPLCEIKNLRAALVHAPGELEEFFYFYSENCSPFYLKPEFAPKDFSSALRKRGFYICMKNSMKTAILEAIIAYLYLHHSTIELPPHPGWYLTQTGTWAFASESTKTLLDIRTEVDYHAES